MKTSFVIFILTLATLPACTSTVDMKIMEQAVKMCEQVNSKVKYIKVNAVEDHMLYKCENKAEFRLYRDGTMK